MTVAEQDGLVHGIDTIWGHSNPERERLDLRSARAWCNRPVLDKHTHEYYKGRPTCMECVVDWIRNR